MRPLARLSCLCAPLALRCCIRDRLGLRAVDQPIASDSHSECHHGLPRRVRTGKPARIRSDTVCATSSAIPWLYFLHVLFEFLRVLFVWRSRIRQFARPLWSALHGRATLLRFPRLCVPLCGLALHCARLVAVTTTASRALLRARAWPVFVVSFRMTHALECFLGSCICIPWPRACRTVLGYLAHLEIHRSVKRIGVFVCAIVLVGSAQPPSVVVAAGSPTHKPALVC